MSNNEHILHAKNIKKSYGKQKVLKGIDFSLLKNERVAIVGGNGAGKTTLLNILSGNDKKYSGELSSKISKKEMSFQFQTTNYPEDFSIFEILYLFDAEKSPKKRKEIVKEKLETVNLLEHKNKNTSELSGGQMQKLNLLLTMATNPKLIFFDEIMSGLDQPSIDDMFNFINKYVIDKTTTITVSHNPKEIFKLCERVIFIHSGKIISDKKMSEYKKLEDLEKEMKEHIIKNDSINYKTLIRSEKTFAVEKDFIEAKAIKKNYDLKKILIGENEEGIDMDIARGERIAIIGKNGSGKSTLVEIIAGVKRATSGLVNVNAKDMNGPISEKIKTLKAKHKDEEDKGKKASIKQQIVKFENKLKTKKEKRGNLVAIQFQKQFYPRNLSLRDVIIFNLKANNIKYDEEYIYEILKSVSLEKFINNSTFEISGGQRQKLNIILTIIKQPPLLILDELTTGLDLLAKEKLISLIKTYLKKTKSTLIMVTHSPEDILELSDKVILLKDGKIEKEIMTKDLTPDLADKILREI